MAVCSPGNIERGPGDRIKTDKRDAIRLARLFAAGDLRLVWVPSEEQEQLRDLVRCREDLRSDLMRARHRLATFLLRRERYFRGPGGRWTLRHRHWLSQQHFDDQASRITYADYLHAHDVLLARRDRVGRELEQLAPSCVWPAAIAALVLPAREAAAVRVGGPPLLKLLRRDIPSGLSRLMRGWPPQNRRIAPRLTRSPLSTSVERRCCTST
jgi:hypothetical protein